MKVNIHSMLTQNFLTIKTNTEKGLKTMLSTLMSKQSLGAFSLKSLQSESCRQSINKSNVGFYCQLLNAFL